MAFTPANLEKARHRHQRVPRNIAEHSDALQHRDPLDRQELVAGVHVTWGVMRASCKCGSRERCPKHCDFVNHPRTSLHHNR